MGERPVIAAGGGTDRITALPDEIIHSILYRLDDPEQAARTSTLSKRWLHLWRSYPVLEFRHDGIHLDHSDVGKIEVKFAGFAAAASRRLSLYHENSQAPLESLKLSLVMFHLHYPQIVRESFTRLVSSALSAGNGPPLEVVVRTNWDYSFPEGSLSNCSRTKVLKLKRCDLNGLEGKISLQNLQVLHLHDVIVQITEQLLYNFVGTAPNLESLSLKWCYGIERLEVSVANFPKLKTLSIQTVPSGTGSEIELLLTTALSLESLVLQHPWKPCKLSVVSLSAAPNLRFVRIHNRYHRDIFPPLNLGGSIFKLPSLQVLDMGDSRLSDELLCSIMANIPHLQSLIFGYLPGIGRVEICHGNLSNLVIFPIDSEYDSQMELQLTSAPCLKSLRFRDIWGICKLNIESPSAAPNLKVLELSGSIVSSQCHLDDLISKLPSLESLYLEINNGSSSNEIMSKIRVSSDSLQVFELHDCYRMETLEELEIDAPNLVTAHYIGSGFRFPGKINAVNVPSDCRFVVEGYGSHQFDTYLTHKWFIELKQSISTLSQFHLVLKLRGLDLSQQVSFDLSQVECGSFPLIIQHLQLELWLSSKLHDVQNGISFLDGLFWICRPKLIRITQDADHLFSEFMHEQFKNKDDANCCVCAKCWRHHLTDAKIKYEILDSDSTTMEIFHG